MDAQANTLITDLLKLANRHEKTRSLKVKQVARMKAGRIRKQLNEKPNY